MNVPKELGFPEVGNASINIALTADKLNEVIRFLRDKYPEENAFSVVPPEYFDGVMAKYKPGVRITSNGRYMLNGRLIKKEEAFL